MTSAAHAQHRRRLAQHLVARARAEWRLQTIRGGCLMCRAFPVDDATRRDRAADLRRLEGHHVLRQQHLKRHGHVDKLWDPRAWLDEHGGEENVELQTSKPTLADLFGAVEGFSRERDPQPVGFAR